jgi:hypothetical protein
MIYDSKLFNWHKETRMLTAEASELGRGEIFDWVPGQPNAGLSVRSHRTGNIVRFSIFKRGRDGEGDTQFWELLPTEEDEKKYNIHDITMKIWND